MELVERFVIGFTILCQPSPLAPSSSGEGWSEGICETLNKSGKSSIKIDHFT